MMNAGQIANIGGLFADLGFDEAEKQVTFLTDVLGRNTQGGDLTEAEATRIEDALNAQKALAESSKGGTDA
jgi:hypothetical protein